MADVQPLRAIHYDPSTAGSLDRLTAQPYDVIDSAQRAQLVGRSPHNVVEIDLPVGGEDPYATAAKVFERWQLDGILTRDTEPAIWVQTQTFRGPDGIERTRNGFYARVGITDYGQGRIRPHERTHPAAKEDRLRLMRATRANLSPIFSLYSDPDGAAWAALVPATEAEPFGAVTDDEGTTHRLWRVTDSATIARVQEALAPAELLIADGHHRYETARTYAEEVGGEGAHRQVLMNLVSMSDPGLAIFPTHRVVSGLDADRRRRLDELLERDFKLTEAEPEAAAPNGSGAPGFGVIEAGGGQARRAELASPELA